jgi:hypothetical protein
MTDEEKLFQAFRVLVSDHNQLRRSLISSINLPNSALQSHTDPTSS